MKYKVGNTDTLKPNTMKNVEAGNQEILLIRNFEGNYYTIESKCTHVGGPLSEGILNKDRVYCPWHHACFNCKSGEMIEPPALDDLNSYNLSIENNELFVELDDEQLGKKITAMDENINESRTYIILGTGAVGLTAAVTLRKEGFQGKIIIISKDKNLPYDRTTLSKSFLEDPVDVEEIQLIDRDRFDDLDIEVKLNNEVVSVDILTKTLTLDSGKNISYDKLLIGTGGKPKEPYVPGNELKNIFTLRNVGDSAEIVNKANKESKCVILGSSFIALETASRLIEKNIEVTIVTKDKIPFENVFGEKLGQLFLDSHKKNGVKFILESGVKRFNGKNKVSSIELDNGTVVETELVIIGIGVEPATDFIRGLKNAEDGSILVDKYLQATKDVFVAGDIASFPDWRDGERIRIEHWRTAMQQGKTAALNMMDKNVKYNSIPFFWTRQAGLNVQYVGYTNKWDEVIIDGDTNSKEFLAYYLLNGKVRAVAGSGKSKEMAAIEELFRLNIMPEDKSFVGNSKILYEQFEKHNEV